MKSDHKTRKYAALTLAAGALIAGSTVSASAAPIAGASGMTAAAISDASGKSGSNTQAASYSTRAGVSAKLSKIVSASQAKAEKKAQDEKEAQEAQAVAAAQAQAEEEARYANLGVANVTDYVFIRTAPDENSDYAGKLYAGNVATVDPSQSNDAWYYVTSNDVSGYIKKDYLIVGDKARVDAVSRRVVTVNTNGLNVRSAADPNASVLTTASQGQELGVTDESNPDWIGVSTAAGNGYVSAAYVSAPATTYNFAESKAAEQARIQAEEAARAAAAAEAAKQEAARQKEAARQAAKSGRKAAASSGSSSGRTYSAPASGSGSAVVSYAAQFVGNPYVWGGTSLTNGADCSGYVMSVYKAFGVSLPHSDAGIRSCGTGVSVSDMQPGDVVCYSGHVGIYAGNGQILNASSAKTGIKYTNVNYKPILAVRRMVQ